MRAAPRATPLNNINLNIQNQVPKSNETRKFILIFSENKLHKIPKTNKEKNNIPKIIPEHSKKFPVYKKEN